MKRAVLLMVVSTLACRSGTTPTVPAPAAQPTPPAAASPLPVASQQPTSQPAAAGQALPQLPSDQVELQPASPAAGTMSDAMHWMRNSAEYETIARQTYKWAARQLEAAVQGRASGSWAVILDADETVVDNSLYLKERNAIGERFKPSTWHAWTKRRVAGSVPGAQGFLRRIRELGGRIAIVTNRAASECADTEANFQANGLPYDVILCNPDVSKPSKEPRFQQVASGTTPAGLPPLDVVMWVGDNIHDFPGMNQEAKAHPQRLLEFGERFILLPNPTYGSWERLPRR